MAFHAPLSNECVYNLRERGWFYANYSMTENQSSGAYEGSSGL